VQLFTEDPEDEWAIETLKFLSRYFYIYKWSSSILIHLSNMPALTRKAKRRHFDSLEEDEGSDNEGTVGILAQRAARRQAAREAEREAQRQQVCFTTS